MPRVSDETLRKRLQDAKEAWDERQKANRSRQRRAKAQADARRRAVIGDMVLSHVQNNPHEHDRLMKRLDAYLKDTNDRALFDLPPRPEAPASPAPHDQPSTVPPPSP